MQQLIIDASSNLDNVSPGMEALMFSIYLCAVMSLQDEECQKLLGRPVAIMIDHFSVSTQKALVNAGFLRSAELNTLHALVLFLVSLQLRKRYFAICFMATRLTTT